jgi:hypothetical protein
MLLNRNTVYDSGMVPWCLQEGRGKGSQVYGNVILVKQRRTEGKWERKESKEKGGRRNEDS